MPSARPGTSVLRRRHAGQILRRLRAACHVAERACLQRIAAAQLGRGPGLGLLYELERLKGRGEGVSAAARALELERIAPEPLLTPACNAHEHASAEYAACLDYHPQANARGGLRARREEE